MISEDSTESKNFSVELPQIISKIALMAEAVRMYETASNKNELSSIHLYGVGAILNDIEDDLLVINETFYGKGGYEWMPKGLKSVVTNHKGEPMTEKQTEQPERATEADYQILEKMTPVAQILLDWSRRDLEDLEIESSAVLEVMGKTLWEVYEEMCQRLEVFEGG